MIVLVGGIIFVALLEFTDIIPTDKKPSSFIPEDWLPGGKDDIYPDTASPTETPVDVLPTPTLSPVAISTDSSKEITSPTSSPTESAPEFCNLKATLTFPDPKDTYYGYSNDQVSVTKFGKKASCDFYNKETTWGCVHIGEAYIHNNESPNYKDIVQSEEALIPDAFGGRFNFHVEHYFNELNEGYYDEDHMIQSTLKLFVNDEKQFAKKMPKNEGVDTHLPDGSINPAYDGEMVITADCDAKCNCEFTKLQKCELEAELSFPDADKASSPYTIRSAHLKGMKKDKFGICEKFNPSTNWGCTHSGTEAYYFKSEYYDETVSNAESVSWADADAGQFTLSVEEFIIGWEYLYDDTVNADLVVKINGEQIKKFEFVEGSMKVQVDCDIGCGCSATLEN